MHLRIRWGGLRTKIIAWFLVPTAIILGVVALFAFTTYQRVTEDLVIERNQEVARLLASQLAVDLGEYTRQLDILAATAEAYRYRADPLTQQTIIRFSTSRLQDFDGGVVILDESGDVLAADQQRLEIIGQDWSDRAYFRQALHASGPSPQPVFSDILDDGPEGAEVVVAALPIVIQGEFSGMSVGFFRLGVGSETEPSPLYTIILRRLREVGGGNIYLVDGNGRAIYHPDVWRIGEDMAERDVVRQVLAGEVSSIRTRDLDGREIVASFAPVPGTSWGLVTEEGWDTLISSSEPYRYLLLVLLALGVVVPALVIAWGASRITRPIAELTGAAQDVAGGNFDQVIRARTGDELEELAAQFNRMSAQLQDSYATLEQRVADRTRELAALNAITAVVSRSLDLEGILHDALDKTLEVMGMEVGMAYRLEEDRQSQVLMAHRGLSQEFVRRAAQVPLQAGVAGAAAGTGAPVVEEGIAYAGSELTALVEQEGVRLTVSVPLVVKGRVLGAMYLGSRTVRDVTPEELALLAAIGQQTGVAVENARLYEQAEEVAVAAERSRLARDLHDAVTQTLFSASMIADVLPRIWARDPDEGRQRLEELRQLTRGALAEMRTLLVELRPSALVEASLRDLLRQLGEAITGRARLPVALEVEGECSLPPDVRVALYRIAQEALNNVFKHAGASHAEVSLRCGADWAELRVHDDGRGFDPASVRPDHLGMGIMRERAEAVGATLTIESEIGRGTEVVALWSL